MIENIIYTLLAIFAIPMFIGCIYLFCHIEKEQEHRHAIELEKAKQGIFDIPTPKESFFKKYSKHILITLGITFLIIIICYFFNIPSNLTKYILEIIN